MEYSTFVGGLLLLERRLPLYIVLNMGVTTTRCISRAA